MFRERVRWIVLMVVVLLAVAPALADEERQRNARITLTAIDQLESGEKLETVHTLVSGPQQKLKLQTSWDVRPDPHTKSPAEEFSYQSIGLTFSGSLGKWSADDQLYFKGIVSLQTSEMHPGKLDVAVTGGQRFEFALYLNEGKQIQVLEIPRIEGGSIRIKIRADLL